MHSDDELETTEDVVVAEPTEEEPVAEDAPADEAPIVGGGTRLVLKRSGAETGIEFPVNSPATVGRFDPDVGPIDVDLGSIDESVYVSRKHALIVCEDNVWKVRDLGSSNGTFVLRDDFERVEEADLVDGTEIAFGNARFVFRM